AAGNPDLQRTTRMRYDLAGHLTLVVKPRAYDNGTGVGPGEAAVATTAYDYDAVGRQTLVVEGVGTPLQRTTRMGYDAADTLLWVLKPRNYDVHMTDPVLDGPDQVRTSYGYDAMNRRTAVIEDYDLPPLRRTTTTAYDVLGNVTK